MADQLKLDKLPVLPLRLNEKLELAAILRFLPGKRLVGKALWQQQPVLLKLMTDNRQGRRLLAQEQAGHQLLQAAGLTLPDIRFTSENTNGLLAIAYQWLPEARSFNEADLQNSNICQQLIRLMATLHQAGLIHDDLHIDNLLLSAEKLFLVDYAAVKKLAAKALSEQQSLKNLALLIVQFTDAGQQYLQTLFADYCVLRNWPQTSEIKARLQKVVKDAWQKRQQAYLKKCFRNCTMTAYRKQLDIEYAMRREFLDKVGQDFIGQLDQFIADGELLKDGNSATVVKVVVSDQLLVIKRYNIKSHAHFLKRCWRPSRAANAWRYGRLLELIGMPTPKVLGFVEKRFGCFRKQAYLITEWTPAKELSARYPDLPPDGDVAEKIDRIFTLLTKYQLHHGDLKASNLLIDNDDHVQLIDLDAMRQTVLPSTFARLNKQDKRRLSKNWQKA